MNTPSPDCGFTARRITYTREMMESLSEIKKENGGSVAKAVQVYHDFYSHTLGDMTIFDLVRFAEDCDKMLADWDKPNGQFVVMGNPS